MKTGIVFKIDGRKAIVLKSDGSFTSVKAKNGWKAGQTVSISSAPRNHAAAFLATAACLTVMAIGRFGWNQLYSAPMALISLDVNPSIELGVNRFDRIISASALNDEGSRILMEADIKNEAYQKALVNILQVEETSGYLTSDTYVVLTVFASDAAVQDSLLTELQGVVDSRLSLYSDQIQTEYHAVDENIVDGAHGHGVTAGKYLYLQELQEVAPESDISEFTHHSIEQIKGEIETCRKGHGTEGDTIHHREKHNRKSRCD